MQREEETDWDISIKFADYRRSESEIVADLVTRLEAGLIDLDSAYEKLYPNLTEDERRALDDAYYDSMEQVEEACNRFDKK